MDQEACRLSGVPFVHAAYGYGRVRGAAAALESISRLPEIAGQLLD